MRSKVFWPIIAAVAVAAVWSAPPATATVFDPTRPLIDPGAIIPGGQGVPPPSIIPGKEFSDNVDRKSGATGGAADPEQNIRWDGKGGTADTFDYSGSRAGVGDTEDRQVDALSNRGDFLFGEVIDDFAHLLFSTSLDPKIYFERHASMAPPAPPGTVSPPGVKGGTWATPLQIDDMTLPTDVDGLEVWGPDTSDDANHYSLIGDPVSVPGIGRVAVWDFAGGVSTPLYTSAAIAAAVGAVIGIDGALLESNIDLDAMMTFDDCGTPGGPGSPPCSSKFPDAKIMFSLAPLTGPGFALDGGEIFVWNGVVGAGLSASYLSHGGHIWDTAFDVMGTFGTASENINALEAVVMPVPATLALFGVGLVGLGLARRRKAAA